MTRALSGDLAPIEIIRLLDMKPHPEGGHYAETFRSDATDGDRASMSAIYYLLQADEVSAWHRIDADETWLWHAGAPLTLTLSPPSGKGATPIMLGPDLRSGQRPQTVVPANHWQAAESLGAWSLLSCIVAPAFQFENFEMAPPDWRPVI